MIHLPRCGLCKNYPVFEGYTYFCPIYEGEVKRTTGPPRQKGRGGHFMCFEPIDQALFNELIDSRKVKECEQTKAGRKKWIGDHAEEINASKKERYKKDLTYREKMKENAAFRSYIDFYNPMRNVLARFRHADRPKTSRTPEQKEARRINGKLYNQKYAERNVAEIRDTQAIYSYILSLDIVRVVLRRFKDYDRYHKTKPLNTENITNTHDNQMDQTVRT